MDLEGYGYSPEKGTSRRRRRLKKAIQDSNFDLVFQELSKLVDEFEGYKSLRAEQDLLFLKNRSDRYFTEKDTYSVKRTAKEGIQSA